MTAVRRYDIFSNIFRIFAILFGLHVASYLQELKPSKKKQKKEKSEKEDKGASHKKGKSEDAGENIWDLGNNRQVNVRDFKGKYYVDIREMYYDKEGDLKPGKKGNIFFQYKSFSVNFLITKRKQ